MDIYNTYNEFIELKKSYCEHDTIRYYRENVTGYLNWLGERMNKNINAIDVHEITKKDYIAYITFLRDRGCIKNTSINTYVRAVKVFFKYLYDEGYVDIDITLRVKMPKSDKAVKMPLSTGEVKQIDNYFDTSSYLGLRNYLMIHLMLDCGLRSSEVINLKVSDIDSENSYIAINKSKCNKSRLIPLGNSLLSYLIKFTQYHDNEYMFYDRYIKDRITSNTIKQLFGKLKRDLSMKRIHAHLLRHTFATSFILGGGSLEILRIILGHSDYNVTKEYLHIATELQILNFDIYRLDKCMFRNYNNY